jgi:opacity protein-like surface antigen
MYKIIFAVAVCCYSLAVKASVAPEVAMAHPLYAGILGGYGSTTWQGLVPSHDNMNDAILLSTPTKVNEGGGVWGAVLGYEFSPYFALEANYMRYPNAHIYFDADSLFAFENNDMLELSTVTQTVSFFARVMLTIPTTDVRLYSSAGVARVQRSDVINNDWRTSPTFGVGINDNLTQHIMLEIASTYTAGYGESELNPAQDFIPFLYAVFAKLAYRF